MNNSYTSAYLTIGQLYTRNELAELFSITDTTLQTGVFQPKSYKSIWLFCHQK